jgi:hypothetical protein
VTEPPETVIFTVIIALIVIILTVPIVLFLEILLENYACIWPGTDDDRFNPKTDEPTCETKVKHEISNESIFGEVINKAVMNGSAYDSYAAADFAQIVYSGLVTTICFDYLRQMTDTFLLF